MDAKTNQHSALILAGGTLPCPNLWPNVLDGEPFVIAADGGLAHAKVLGVTPQLLVGDLDSVEPTDMKRFDGIQVDRHPVDKDQLDLELALNAAWARGVTEVRVAGALGGRLDQTLAALLIAGKAAREGCRVVLYGGRTEAHVGAAHAVAATGQSALASTPEPVSANTVSASLTADTTVSLLALDQNCVVSISGVQFPLANAALPWGSGLGVSNRATGGVVELKVHSGTVALLIEHLEPAPREGIWGDLAERIGASIGNADPDLRDIVERFVYDEVFARPGLDLATRELLSVALLTSLGAGGELTTHLRGALRTGATERQVREAILHSAVFVGVPRALNAMREFERLLKK